MNKISNHPVSVLWIGFLAGAGAFGADSPAAALAQAMPMDDADPIPGILAAIRSAVTAAGAARDPEWQPAGFEATFFAGGGLSVRFGTGRTQMNFYTDAAGQKPHIWADVKADVDAEEARAAQESVAKRMAVAQAAIKAHAGDRTWPVYPVIDPHPDNVCVDSCLLVSWDGADDMAFAMRVWEREGRPLSTQGLRCHTSASAARADAEQRVAKALQAAWTQPLTADDIAAADAARVRTYEAAVSGRA